jgi:hypothetical protein
MEKELDTNLDEAKATGEESYAADATTAAGGAVKKRKADLFKAAGAPQAGTPVVTPQGTNNAGLHEMIASIFDGADLSEEFKMKTTTIFEAAIHERVEEIRAELEEEFEAELTEQVEVVVEELSNKLDSYLDYVIENWMEENEVALEAGYKVQVAESIINGLKALVEDHDLEIEESELDVIAAMEEQVATTEQKYNELFEAYVAEREEKETLQKNAAIAAFSEGLVDTDAARFNTLAEGVSYESVEDFVAKLEVIKESYFSESVSRAEDQAEVLEEEVLEEAKAPAVNPAVAAYVNSLNKFAKI